jgi:alkylation response protein AidB-like acyl-CoA dehydrogenase
MLLDICRWSTQRIVFGKPLTSQPVIRSKLASMISRVEACQNWLESITYQMNNVRVLNLLVLLAGINDDCIDVVQ